MSASVAMEDWDTMFDAVKTRLALSAQSQFATVAQPMTAQDAQVARFCATVLECVTALDQLQITARDAMAGRDQFRS